MTFPSQPSAVGFEQPGLEQKIVDNISLAESWSEHLEMSTRRITRVNVCTKKCLLSRLKNEADLKTSALTCGELT